MPTELALLKARSGVECSAEWWCLWLGAVQIWLWLLLAWYFKHVTAQFQDVAGSCIAHQRFTRPPNWRNATSAYAA